MSDLKGQILLDILKERERQDEKWGEQNHHPLEWLGVLMEEVGEASQEVLHLYFGGIEPQRLRDYRVELVQVAAVVVAAIEALDRGTWSFSEQKES